ncbi:MAG: hypothetical protein ABIS07_06635 [Dokdonella sp.]
MAFRASHAWTLCLFSMVWSSAPCVQIEYVAGLAIEHNDNINVSETAAVGDTILKPTLAFTLDQSGSTVQAAANGIFEYRDFLQGHFGDDFLGQLNGRMNWSAIPGRLNFGIEDYLGVQPINQLAPDTPGNQQQTNVFAMGPTLNFRLGPTVRGQAELRYTNSYADETDQFNSDRVSGALRAIKDLSAGSTLSANLIDERIRFRDSDIGQNYNRYSAFGRYTRNGSRFDLTTDFGYSWINYSGNALGAQDRNDALARATLDWHLSDRSTLTIDVAHQLSDAASRLLTGSTIGAETGNAIPAQIATGSAATTSAAYLENRVDFGYAYRGPRASFTLAPYFRKLDYGAASDTANIADPSGQAINQTARGASITAAWLLRPLLGVGVIASGENLRYDGLSREDKTWNVQAFIRQQLTPHWSWRADVTRYDRNSNAAGQSADQNIVSVQITYAR